MHACMQVRGYWPLCAVLCRACACVALGSVLLWMVVVVVVLVGGAVLVVVVVGRTGL